MGDTDLLYREFANYTELVQADRFPNEDDIDYFLKNFLKPGQLRFFYLGSTIRCADGTDDHTGEKIFDREGKNFSELKADLKPLLVSKVKKTYGTISEGTNPFPFDPEPKSLASQARIESRDMGISTKDWEDIVSSGKQSAHAAYRKAIIHLRNKNKRIGEYMSKALPFMLRQTMYHPFRIGIWDPLLQTPSKTIKIPLSLGTIKPISGRFSIDSEKELQTFLTSKEMGSGQNAIHAGTNPNIKFMFWKYTESGNNLKMAVLDIDNPAELSKSDVRSAVKKIALKLESRNHPYIIMFTGNNYQIWFGKEEGGQGLGNLLDVKTYLQDILLNQASFKKKDAIQDKRVLIDPDMFTEPKATRMFFSLHYPFEKASDPSTATGLAAIPVNALDLTKFNPLEYAHPDAVLSNFDIYAARISHFFDKVEIGQDYEREGEIESEPTCQRLGKTHKSDKLLTHLSTPENTITIPIEQAKDILADEEEVYVYFKAKGLDCILTYQKKGIRFGGIPLEIQRTVGGEDTRTLISEPVTSTLITANGNVIYDDYITRSLERFAIAKNYDSITLSGQLVKQDQVGNQLGSSAPMAVIQKKPAIDVAEMRQLYFVPNKIIEVNGKKIKIKDMRENLSQISTAKIHPIEHRKLIKPVGEAAVKAFKKIRRDRKASSMILEGDNTYQITSARTISATIIGLDKTSKLYQQDSAEIAPVYVAVTKRDSTHGLVYYIIGKAEISLKKEDRIRLKELVLGKDGENIIPFQKKVLEDPELEGIEDVQIVEPSIVVDIKYDDVGVQLTNAFAWYFLKGDDQRPFLFRPLAYPMEEYTKGKKVRPKYITPLIMPKVVDIRTDLNFKSSVDIDISQDPLIKVSSKTPPKGMSLIDALPNPSRDYQAHCESKVLRNPAFTGVQQTRLIEMPSDIEVPPLIETVRGVGEVTIPRPKTKKTSVHLFKTYGKTPGEFQKAYERFTDSNDFGVETDGYKVFVDPQWTSPGTPTNFSTGDMYTLTSLGPAYQDAMEDSWGYGSFGTKVVSMDHELDKEKIPFTDQLSIRHFANKEQFEEDKKITHSALLEVPGDIASERKGTRYLDEDYKLAVTELNGKLKESLKSRDGGSNTLKDSKNRIFANPPPVKAKAWERRIDEFVKEYKTWEESAEPKQPWLIEAQGLFMVWEVPLLEKERLLRIATSEYALSDEEVGMVDTQFGESMDDEQQDSIFADLYEEVIEDDESEDDEQ